MIGAHFLDGKTASRHAVDLTFETDASGKPLLRIRGAQTDVLWPFRSMRRVPAGSREETRFQLANSDSRLVLSAAAAHTLETLAPELFRRNNGLGPIAGVGALAVTAAAIVGLVFFGAPMLAGPIARATPLEVERSYAAATNPMIDLITRPCEVPEFAQAEADALMRRLAEVSASPFETKLSFVTAGFPNAFALPAGQIMVTGELLEVLETPEELAGVLAHETAHVARRHVMAALVRELGGAALLDLVVGGGSGAGQQIALAGLELQGLSHGRAAEREADSLAVQYLADIGVDPTALATFLETIAELSGGELSGGENGSFVELLSTHPAPLRRADEARAIAAEISGGVRMGGNPPLSAKAWAAIKESCVTPE